MQFIFLTSSVLKKSTSNKFHLSFSQLLYLDLEKEEFGTKSSGFLKKLKHFYEIESKATLDLPKT